jgi:hypothetical protein
VNGTRLAGGVRAIPFFFFGFGPLKLCLQTDHLNNADV